MLAPASERPSLETQPDAYVAMLTSMGAAIFRKTGVLIMYDAEIDRMRQPIRAVSLNLPADTYNKFAWQVEQQAATAAPWECIVRLITVGDNKNPEPSLAHGDSSIKSQAAIYGQAA